jgi:trans-aconitate 3-methyltransferase
MLRAMKPYTTLKSYRMYSKAVTEFANKSFSGQRYDNARPKYPPELYSKIKRSYNEYVQDQADRGITEPKIPIFIDLGCGPGTVTYDLSEHVSSNALVFGLDPSMKMIEAATEKSHINHKTVKFDISDENSFQNYFSSKYGNSKILNNTKVNLITAAQCSHWFNFPNFLKNSYEVLKEGNTGGKLFIFGYIQPVIWNIPELDDIIQKLDNDLEQGFGKYWEQPGRDYLNNLLTDEYFTKALEESSFENIKVERFYTSKNRDPFVDDGFHSYELKKTTTMRHFRDYVTSWSAYNKCKREKGEKYADGIIDQRFNEMFQKVSTLSYDSKIDLVWATYIIEATCST